MDDCRFSRTILIKWCSETTLAGRTLDDFQILNVFKTMGDHRHEDSSNDF